MSNENRAQHKPFIAHQLMLRERLHYLIDTLHPMLKRDLEFALQQEGKLLCASSNILTPTRPNGMWALLPLLISRDLDPKSDLAAACNVAVAVECLICALDLLDDIEDGDTTPTVSHLGTAATLNVSTTLLFLAQKALLSLKEAVIPLDRIVSLFKILQENSLLATAGQQEDILSEEQPIEQFTEEDCIRIARGKAGSLMSLACKIGCVFVGSDGSTTSLFAELGELLGISHQLSNDGHDLYNILHMPGETVKTDLKRQKKTLPFLLANQRKFDHPDSFHVSETESQNLFLKFLDEGIITTWGISLLYRERARDCLRKIEAKHFLSDELHILLGFE